MTMQEAYRLGETRLVRSGIREARLDAWYLLEHVTAVSRAIYYTMQDRQLEKEQEKRYFYCIEQRSMHIPLQHLTGVQEFMGLDFRVNEHVLIPRQDTETVVEEALQMICHYAGNFQVQQKNPCYKVLDMCTGSGCILLSILHHGRHGAGKGSPLSLEGMGADISKKALAVAGENARTLQIDAEFVESDLFENVKGTYNMIVSNPPYIKTEVIHTLQEEVKLHDPWIALDGKTDGLYFYKKITQGAPGYLERGGSLLFEIGSDQAADVSALMQKSGFQNIVVKKDLAGLDRALSGVYAG